MQLAWRHLRRHSFSETQTPFKQSATSCWLSASPVSVDWQAPVPPSEARRFKNCSLPPSVVACLPTISPLESHRMSAAALALHRKLTGKLTCCTVLVLVLLGTCVKGQHQNITVDAIVPAAYKTKGQDQYVCFRVDLPPRGLKLIGVDPLSTQDVVHHMLLYGEQNACSAFVHTELFNMNTCFSSSRTAQ